MPSNAKPLREQVLKEWSPLGKYRVRLLRDAIKPAEESVLDIREYVSSAEYEGYTRRGVKISSREHFRALREVLTDLLERRS